MNIWIVSREYAGIAEAGGVKNVACSLSESLAKLSHNVTLFIPLYGCTDLTHISSFSCCHHSPVVIDVCGKSIPVSFSSGVMNKVNIVFIGNKAFSEKKAVYTYTKDEEKTNPAHKHGFGHEDVFFLNTLFQKAVAAYGLTCKKEEAPNVVHCQDATAALVPVFIKDMCKKEKVLEDFFKDCKCFVTIHNAGPGYHHEFHSLRQAQDFTGLDEGLLKKGYNSLTGAIEPFLLAADCAELTTVSPEYANEILSGKCETAGLSFEFSKLKTSISGITNGIDFSRYNPADTASSLLPFAFNPAAKDLEGKRKCLDYFLSKCASEKINTLDTCSHIEKFGYLNPDSLGQDPIYIAFHGRIVTQKGISVMARAVDLVLKENLPVRFIFIGQGQADLEKELLTLSLNYEGKCVFFHGYDRALSRLCMAVADFALFPSLFEPCGLEDFIAQIYGTLPIAHSTGGLCKIISEETGFLYHTNTPEELAIMIHSLVTIMMRAGRTIFSNMISYAASYVQENYSWSSVAEKYLTLYRKKTCKKI